MFVGREAELRTLERLFDKGDFRMAVVYGRRRVGKTALLDEFAKGKPALFFTAQQKSNAINLRSFSRAVYRFFGLPDSAGVFEDWESALEFVAESAKRRGRFVFVFDEFPYAAQAEPSLPSTLQIAIDHAFKGTNVCMVLCGSNEGFMEGEVLGRNSPLYGRRHAQIKLKPFDYLDAARMMPTEDPVERTVLYSMFGGTPYYLEQIDPDETIEQNVARLFFDISGILYAEPEMLLRQELREPAQYSSVLDAVAAGATTPKSVADKSGVAENSVRKYLTTLTGLGILERVVPFGESERSRKSAYRIQDPFYSFWYKFVSPNIGAIEAGAGEAAARLASGQTLNAYVGKLFETVCRQWLVRQNQTGRLPFLASSFGCWWGTDPAAREQADIDVIAADLRTKSILLGECKWRERFDETAAINTLIHRAELVKGYRERFYVLFTKNSPSEGTARKAAERPDVRVVTVGQMYDEPR